MKTRPERAHRTSPLRRSEPIRTAPACATQTSSWIIHSWTPIKTVASQKANSSKDLPSWTRTLMDTSAQTKCGRAPANIIRAVRAAIESQTVPLIQIQAETQIQRLLSHRGLSGKGSCPIGQLPLPTLERSISFASTGLGLFPRRAGLGLFPRRAWWLPVKTRITTRCEDGIA